jgi:hypothetical protein
MKLAGSDTGELNAFGVKVRMQRKLTRVAWILSVMIGLAIGIRSQESNSSNELWPEVDVYVPLNEKVRLVFLVAITKSQETRNNTEGQFAVHVDYTASRRLVLRAGYQYGFSITEADPFKEHRPLVEQTLRQKLPLKTLLSDRNREEFRFVNGDFSFRYRNRLTFEREFLLPKRSITPYGAIEVYHDSRFKAWNRNRLTVGVQVQLRKALPLLSLVIPRKQVVLDLYYTKQNDSRSQPNHINAIGTAVAIHF